MELKEIRKKIKRLDYEILHILNERMELSLKYSRQATKRQDKDADHEFIDHIHSIPEQLVRKEFIDTLFKEITSEVHYLHTVNRKMTGFQGEHGANSEIAVKTFDPSLIPIPCMKFVDVFEGVDNDWLDLGMVPIENSLEGGVTEVNDLLIRSPLFICGEVKVKIHHTLMTLHETDPKGIRVVYSHPQALAQCRDYIHRHNFEDRPFYNTAGAARMLSETRPKASAVIANKLCAEIYDLKIIEDNIQDENSNFTRFVLLSKTQFPGQGDKCSIVFSTNHRCGALNQVLTLFAEAGINLTRIESRPSRKEPGNFLFLADFSGSLDDPKISLTLDKVKNTTVMYRFLGCYKESPLPLLPADPAVSG